MTKDPLVYVKHIRDAIGDIESFVSNMTERKFYLDTKTQDAVIRKIMIIGEATKNISRKQVEKMLQEG